MPGLSRREFLKSAGAAAALLGVGAGLPPPEPKPFVFTGNSTILDTALESSSRIKTTYHGEPDTRDLVLQKGTIEIMHKALRPLIIATGTALTVGSTLRNPGNRNLKTATTAAIGGFLAACAAAPNLENAILPSTLEVVNEEDPSNDEATQQLFQSYKAAFEEEVNSPSFDMYRQAGDFTYGQSRLIKAQGGIGEIQYTLINAKWGGYDVFFVQYTDEHGKIMTQAIAPQVTQSSGSPPETTVSFMIATQRGFVPVWQDVYSSFDIGSDGVPDFTKITRTNITDPNNPNAKIRYQPGQSFLEQLLGVTVAEAAAPPKATPTPAPTITPSPIPSPTNRPTEAPTLVPATPTVAATKEPTIKIGQDTLTVRTVNAAVLPYVTALNAEKPKEQQITLEQVLADLTEAKQKDGTKVVITKDRTILLEQSKEGVWQKSTLRSLATKDGRGFGISVDGAEPYQTSLYRETAAKEFSILMPTGSFMSNTLAKYGDGMARNFASLADTNNMTLRIHPLFWHQDIPAALNSATPAQVESYMNDRAKQLMVYAKQLANDGHPVQLTFASEARWYYNGNFGWEKSPYYTAFGENWVTKAYIIAYKAAQEAGLQIGKDIDLNYQDYDIEAPGADHKVDDTIALLKRVKSGATQELGIKEDDVKIGVGMNFHVHADVANQRGWIGPYTQDLFAEGAQQKIMNIMNKLSTIGPVRITEFDVSGTTDLNVKAHALQVALNACLDSNSCQDFTVFQPLRFESSDNESLFNKDYSPTNVYYIALQSLSKHLLQ